MKKYFIGLALLILLCTACTVKDPLRSEENAAPSLSGLRFVQTVLVAQDTLYPVSVKVTDPQGISDIAQVLGSVQKPGTSSGKQIEFRDDGQNGDIIPKDGIFYFNLTLEDFNTGTGIYLLQIEARDLADLASEVLTDTIFVMAGDPPKILNVQAPDSVDEAGLSAINFTIDVKDFEGLDDVDSLYANLYYPWQDAPFYQLIFHAGSSLGDSLTTQDSFQYQKDLSSVLKIPTDYTFKFIAVDRNGLQSVHVQKTIKVNRPNDAPILSNLVAPDQVTLPAEGDINILLTVKVDDAQGDADIEKVWFDTIKPDGNPSSGNPFAMYDDGLSEDITARDGVYSLKIYMTSTNDPGTYTFNFQSQDRSGAKSNIISHELTVVE